MTVETSRSIVEPVTLQIVVQDTGVGINQGELDEAMESLLANTKDGGVAWWTSRKHEKGDCDLAVGYVICRQLLETMHGSMAVKSAYGEGSRVEVTCQLEKTYSNTVIERSVSTGSMGAAPAAELEPVGDPAASARGAPADESTFEILVVEDNELNAWVVCNMLRSRGLRVRHVYDGSFAVELVAHTLKRPATPRVDLILIDCSMAHIDGYTATALIRHLEARSGGVSCTSTGARVPIVALTAFAMTADRIKCLEAGMDDYLTKPVHKSALLKLVDQYICQQGVTSRSEFKLPGAGHRSVTKGGTYLAHIADFHDRVVKMVRSLQRAVERRLIAAVAVEAEELVQMLILPEYAAAKGHAGRLAALSSDSAAAGNDGAIDAQLSSTMGELESSIERRWVDGTPPDAASEPAPSPPSTGAASTADAPSVGGTATLDEARLPVPPVLPAPAPTVTPSAEPTAAPSAAESSTPAPAADEPPRRQPRSVLNPEKMLADIGGERSMMCRLLQKFAERSGPTIAKLYAAAAARDFKTLYREAHSLKGSSDYVSSECLRNAALTLQKAAGIAGEGGEPDPPIDTLVRQVNEEMDLVLAAIDKELAASPAPAAASQPPPVIDRSTTPLCAVSSLAPPTPRSIASAGVAESSASGVASTSSPGPSVSVACCPSPTASSSSTLSRASQAHVPVASAAPPHPSPQLDPSSKTAPLSTSSRLAPTPPTPSSVAAAETDHGEEGDDAVVDWMSALANFGGDESVLTRLLVKFEERAKPTMDKIRRAAENNDLHVLQRESYSLHGSAGYIAASRLKTAALAFELLVEDETNQPPTVKPRPGRFDAAVERCAEEQRRVLVAIAKRLRPNG